MGAITGDEYVERIDRQKSEVWIDGKKVEGRISEHPAFKGIIKTQASLYDLQHDQHKKDILTYVSPLTGDRVGTSYLHPKTKEDLEKRRLASTEWAEASFGLLGRSPDYMNTALMTFAAASELFCEQEKKCGDNLLKFYEYCREQDISLTHTFVQPQVNRSEIYFEDTEEPIAARIVSKNGDGIVIKGARLLATQGGITDEILVFPSGSFFKGLGKDDPNAYAFSIPSNQKGLKFVSRQPLNYKESRFDSPLGSRFEENDAIVIFDNVVVPWDRVFLYGNCDVAAKLYQETTFHHHAIHQTISRQIVKTKFMLGVMQLLAETINIHEYLHIKEKISELIVALETMKGFLFSAEKQAKLDKWGTMTPDMNALSAAIHYYPRVYPRFLEILQQLGASGLVSLPTEADFRSELGEDLEKYLQSATTGGYERVKLFRLAWDLCMSAFGSRQLQYERYFFGDPVRLTARLYDSYPKENFVQWVKLR
ncbi:4-hydroxyphenylacetate 3-monooxygenase, oxygenase component [Pueribacillus theae]|uniref:4-hydroxyphenylacetate 3-monooxygenase, oxygenase component n=1 Tax=Pueribacillus theae TaxID=2171751 RepID=A0A2U1K6A8_9BACI|nr:4-hydroxyphenylacetate 3-monooxygenase, oxygenase component [Pueribacillus theae]PWA13076.1 4-hydroxyphenylacetate 3-monooxygenase, oxygenase component [Pueribacillus theae]